MAAAETAAFATAAVTWLCVCSTGRHGAPPDAAWAAANVICDAAAVAVAIAAEPAEYVAAQPARKAGPAAPVKPAAPPAAAARTVTVHRVVSVQASAATDSQSAIEFDVQGSRVSANQQVRNCNQVSFRQTACQVV